MNKRRARRRALCVLLGWGCLFAGPCGITTLQFQDFATSSIIRTTVTTIATVLEAAIVQSAQSQDNGN